MTYFGGSSVIPYQNPIVGDYSRAYASSNENPDNVFGFAARAQPFLAQRSQVSIIS